MKMFLTSSVASVAHDIADRIDLTTNNSLVFIDTAAEPEKNGDLSWLEADRQSLVDAGFEVADYTITNKTETELKEFLPSFDYIYLSGGHTEHLLTQSYRTGFYNYIKELIESGKTYIGTSAGSIIAGPYVPEYLADETVYPEVKDKPAYGFVNFSIVPHWGSEHFKKEYLEERLHAAYKTTLPPFVLLSDTQYVYIENDFIKLITVE